MFLRTKVTKILLSEDKKADSLVRICRRPKGAEGADYILLKILFPIVVVVAQLLEFARVGFETAALGLEVEISPYRRT